MSKQRPPRTGLGCAGHVQFEFDCTRCREAKNAYRRKRYRGIVTGTWRYRVPSAEVKAHLEVLTGAGMTLQAVGRAANVSPSVLSDVRNDLRRYVLGSTAAAVFAVAPPAMHPGCRDGLVPTLGSERRVRALAAIGWNFQEQGRRAGVDGQRLLALAKGRQRGVAEDVAERIKALYVELSSTSAPRSREATLTLALAARHGWARPVDWDDDSLDAPDATPNLPDEDTEIVDEVAVRRLMCGFRVEPLRTPDRNEAVRRLAEDGVAHAEIGHRVRLATSTVGDLVRQMRRARQVAA